MKLFSAILAIALLSAAPAAAGQARIIDGDSITLDGRQIRLYGIDAPEWDQTCGAPGATWPCGRAATDALHALADGRDVTCEHMDTDRYGRDVARCHAAGVDLSAQMAASGLALAYRKYSADYIPQEDAAHAQHLGLWSGDFMPPWDWRHFGRRQAHSSK
jgi:endonuclease YncB( thermonuclease family)